MIPQYKTIIKEDECVCPIEEVKSLIYSLYFDEKVYKLVDYKDIGYMPSNIEQHLYNLAKVQHRLELWSSI